MAHLRHAFAAALAAGTVLVTGACAAPPTPGPGPTTAAFPTAGSAPPSSATAVAPVGWRVCTNAHVGYSIGYPGHWYTTALRPEEACSQFHPTPFTIPPDSEYPLTALVAGRVPALPAEPVDPLLARSVLWEKTSVDDHPAIRFEEELTGEGLHERGTRRYGYVVDLDGRALTVYTIAAPRTAEYPDWKVVVDRAVHTLKPVRP